MAPHIDVTRGDFPRRRGVCMVGKTQRHVVPAPDIEDVVVLHSQKLDRK